MKKIIMLFLALMFIFNVKDVFAQDQYTLTLEKQNGIFMSRRGANYDDDSHPYYIYKMNGLFAYCIEPGKHISTYTYVGTSDYIDLPFSEELKEKLELIGYYGRDYPGHDNVRYSMAAQALIWELTGVDTVTFWTELNEQGEEINVSKERNEIMNLVNNHKTIPNFKSSYTGNLKREIVINDTNNVLSNYEVESSSIGDVYIDNNALHIMPNKVGEYTLSLKRKSYDEYNTIIFVGKGDNSSQKLGRLHFNKEIKMDIKITVNGIRLSFHKIDENNNPVRLSNIKFKIKNLTTGEYVCSGISSCIHITDSSGSFLTEALDYGEYEIEEVENQIIMGYIWNSEKMKIKLDSNTVIKWNSSMQHNYVDVYFKNYSIPITVNIHKTGEVAVFDNNTISYKEDKLAGITFDIVTSNNVYVDTAVTDSNGIAQINNLKVGRYYFIEKPNSKYIANDKILFTVYQNSPYQTSITRDISINNKLKKGQLEFSKVDSKTNVGIDNTTIEIYDENNNLLLTRKTDSNGKVIVDNLPVGKYYIKEIEANYYYQISNEKISFEIKEDGEVVKTIMPNKKIMGNVIIKKTGDKLNIIHDEIDYDKVDLSDIEFDIYNESDELISTIKTNDSGIATYELELGKYYFVEKTKLNNYLDNDEKYYFEIKKDGNKAIDVNFDIVNYLKKGKLEFSKVDLKTNIGIDNTIIEIYDENNNLLLTRKTDFLGKVIVNNLPLGKYYIKEKEANYNYNKIDDEISFEIKDNNEIVKVLMTNKRITGSLEINKNGERYQIADEEMVYEKIQLANIEFDLFDMNDNLIITLKTNVNGYVMYSDLPLGKYYLIEKTNLDNYVLNNEKIYFEIVKENNKAIDIKLNIDNYLKKGSLEFTKEDLVTGDGIPNTIIEIYDRHNNLWFTKETDESGKVIINNLPTGKYYILEKEANSRYLITNEKVFFEIKDDREIVKTKMTNKKKEIPVPKTNTYESIMANTLFISLFIIGIGRMYYERKESY